MRGPWLEASEHRLVLRHELYARRVESLNHHARQHAVELCTQYRVNSRSEASRRIHKGEFGATAPPLPMFCLRLDDEEERDVQTVRTCAQCFQPNAVGLAVPGEIECSNAAIPGRQLNGRARLGICFQCQLIGGLACRTAQRSDQRENAHRTEISHRVEAECLPNALAQLRSFKQEQAKPRTLEPRISSAPRTCLFPTRITRPMANSPT